MKLFKIIFFFINLVQTTAHCELILPKKSFNIIFKT